MKSTQQPMKPIPRQPSSFCAISLRRRRSPSATFSLQLPRVRVQSAGDFHWTVERKEYDIGTITATITDIRNQ